MWRRAKKTAIAQREGFIDKAWHWLQNAVEDGAHDAVNYVKDHPDLALVGPGNRIISVKKHDFGRHIVPNNKPHHGHGPWGKRIAWHKR